MRSKFKISLLLISSCILLTGCTTKNPPTKTQSTDQNPSETKTVTQQKATTSSQETTLTVDQVLEAVEKASTLSNSMKMVLRREVDDTSMYDEGEGFTIRSTTDDPIFTSHQENIENALKELNFSSREYKPKSSGSFVTKFIKYTKGALECTFEIRKIGSTGQSDLTFGCL